METCLTVSLCKDRTSVGMTTSEVVRSQPTTYCIITDRSLMCSNSMFPMFWQIYCSNAGGVCTGSVLALLPVVYHYAVGHLCCLLHCNVDIDFHCPSTAVEVICNHSGSLPSMQSSNGLFPLLSTQTWHSFPFKSILIIIQIFMVFKPVMKHEKHAS